MKGLTRDRLSLKIMCVFSVVSLKVIHIFLSALILNSYFTLTPNLTLCIFVYIFAPLLTLEL